MLVCGTTFKHKDILLDCIATFGSYRVRLSLLSVTRMYCDEMIEAKITQFSMNSSEMPQLLAWQI